MERMGWREKREANNTHIYLVIRHYLYFICMRIKILIQEQ